MGYCFEIDFGGYFHSSKIINGQIFTSHSGTGETVSEAMIDRYIQRVRGHIVEFPLHFLRDDVDVSHTKVVPSKTFV